MSSKPLITINFLLVEILSKVRIIYFYNRKILLYIAKYCELLVPFNS